MRYERVRLSRCPSARRGRPTHWLRSATTGAHINPVLPMCWPTTLSNPGAARCPNLRLDPPGLTAHHNSSVLQHPPVPPLEVSVVLTCVRESCVRANDFPVKGAHPRTSSSGDKAIPYLCVTGIYKCWRQHNEHKRKHCITRISILEPRCASALLALPCDAVCGAHGTQLKNTVHCVTGEVCCAS